MFWAISVLIEPVAVQSSAGWVWDAACLIAVTAASRTCFRYSGSVGPQIPMIVGAEWEWLEDDRLRTVRGAPATVAHPRTGRRVWFNHLVLFHQSSLPQGLRRDLVALFGEGGLPNDVLFGDGSPIPDEMVAAVRTAFERRAQRFDWHRHDLLVIDNMRWSHGREAFTGERRVLVSMSDLITRADLPQPALRG